MSLSAEYQGVTLTPLLGWSVVETPVATFDGKKAMETVRTYVVRTYFQNATAAEKKADFDTIEAALQKAGGTLKITQDGVLVAELKPADTYAGQPHASVAVPDQAADRLKAGFNVPLTLTVTGTVDAPSGTTIIASAQETSVATDKKFIQTRTVKGQVRVQHGASASGQLSTVDPGTPAGFERESSVVTTDDQDLRMDYTLVDRQRATSGQKQTTAAEERYATRLSVQDGRETWTLTGRLSYLQTQTPRRAYRTRF